MSMRFIAVSIVAMIATSAVAQQAPPQQQADPAVLQTLLDEMAKARDENAHDLANAWVLARAQARRLGEEVAKLKAELAKSQARVQELEQAAAKQQ